MKRKTKLIIGLSDRLVSLLDVRSELLFAQRPHLWQNGEIYNCENLEERTNENDKAICETIKALTSQLVKAVPEKTQITKQRGIFSMVDEIVVNRRKKGF